MPNQRTQLLDEGYCIIPNALSSAFIAHLRESTDVLIDAMSQQERATHRSTGSMISVRKCEACGELAGHRDLHLALKVLGFSDWRYTNSGYIISKPPHSPPLFWHFDWSVWDHPFSYGRMPAQLFIMVYLVDTSRRNGCLRVIPRSHVNEHPLHEIMGQAHSDELRQGSDPSLIEFQPHPDAVDVTVKAGDLVIGDSRLIHGAHGNGSDHRRTVITLWFHPGFSSLPQPIQAFVAGGSRDLPDEMASWNPQVRQRLYDLLPVYEGKEKPPTSSRERLSREAFFAKQHA